ncbi:MAG: M20/M25/M40 family metallo-hydrolase [Phycisphaerales bacterium]
MSKAAIDLNGIFKALEQNEQAAIDRLIEWLRIPSISTDSKYRPQCRDAARWAVDRLAEAGIEAELVETGTPEKPGHPIVWAEYAGADDYAGPHVLFYGHYDVQPPEPLELWESPPFEPVIKEADGSIEDDVPQRRVVARGAVDDKGQVASFLEALRAWKEQHGQVPVRFTILLEGEEESGSVHLDQFVREPCEARAVRHLRDFRHGSTRSGQAGDHDGCARHGVHEHCAARAGPGPALGDVGRQMPEPDQRADEGAGAVVGRGPEGDDPGVLPRCATDLG